MNLSSNLLLLLLITLSLYTLTSESTDPAANFCNDNTKANTTISRNIDALLPKLVSGTIQNGFIATSYGGVHGLAQCRGDVSSSDCASCIQDAANEIRTLCPSQSDARIWYDFCFLRYSTQKFFGGVDVSGVYLINTQNVTDPEVFNKKLSALMDEISSEAVRTSSRGLGRGKSDVSEFVKLYALVQCTRDLSEINCAQCLAIAVSNFPTVCGNKRGCRVLYSSCYVRYELYPFFFPLDSQESLGSSSEEKYERVMALKN